MTRDRRLLLLLGLLMAYGLFVVECKYQRREDAATETRHRHRHKHESANRGSHRDLDRKSWQEVDYEYNGDSEDGDSSSAEDDYELRPYYDHFRSHQKQRFYHGRMLEPRYPDRYHGYHGSGWHDKDDRRKILSRHNDARSRRYPPGKTYYDRYLHDRDEFDDDAEGDLNYGRLRKGYGRHRYDRRAHRRFDWVVMGYPLRRHPFPRKDWRSKLYGGARPAYLDAKRHRFKDRAVDRDKESRTHSSARPWSRSNASEFTSLWLENESKSEEDEDEDEDEGEEEDYKDRGGLEENDKDEEEDEEEEEDEDEDEEEDDPWKIFVDKDDEDEDETEELDNDFYKSKSKAALAYDDIIKRLTFDDSTTAKTTVKRDYRNIEDRYTKREGYRSFKYEPRNISRGLGPYTYAHKPIINRSRVGTAISTTVKSTVSDDRKSPHNAIGTAALRNDWQPANRTAVKSYGALMANNKNKRDDLDNDGYLYNPDNKEEEKDMQADVINTDYTNNDGGETTPVNTTSVITSTSTTTTPKWPVNRDGKNTRTNERGTAAQYSGYQPKNDYPPMSAHSGYKWQTLGTRESVQQTRNNMLQLSIKNDPAYREAQRYSEKVKNEASCRWPRAKVIRVSDARPDPSVNYHPHCAILHECSDSTGCCKSDDLTCVANKSHTVQLTFYTTSVNGNSNVVKIEFVNHTECGCVSREIHKTPSPVTQKTPSTKPCKCTKYFTAKKVSAQDDCKCICQKNTDSDYASCIQITRGKRPLSGEDRECIKNNECTAPYCDFGTYLHSDGKCPTRWTAINKSVNHDMYQRPIRKRTERRQPRA